MSPKTKQKAAEPIGKAVDPWVLQIIRQMEFDGAYGKIDRQLDRQEYIAVNKVLEACGGKWNRKAKAHTFETPSARDAVEAVLESGRIVDPKQYFQFFETPPELAAMVVELADLRPGQTVLEPSAGKGALCRAIGSKYESIAIQAYELNPQLEEPLRAHPDIAHVTIGDFLAEPARAIYDRVVMNPPFSRQQDIDHVRHAFDFLLPGGKLVAIMSPGFTFRSNRKSREFKQFVDEHEGVVHQNPADAFKSSGTTVSTVTVVLEN